MILRQDRAKTLHLSDPSPTNIYSPTVLPLKFHEGNVPLVIPQIKEDKKIIMYISYLNISGTTLPISILFSPKSSY